MAVSTKGGGGGGGETKGEEEVRDWKKEVTVVRCCSCLIFMCSTSIRVHVCAHH